MARQVSTNPPPGPLALAMDASPQWPEPPGVFGVRYIGENDAAMQMPEGVREVVYRLNQPSVSELFSRGLELAVHDITVTYHPSGDVVVCAWGEPAIDLPDAMFVARARTVEVAAKRVLAKLTAKRRLKRIAEDRDGL